MELASTLTTLWWKALVSTSAATHVKEASAYGFFTLQTMEIYGLIATVWKCTPSFTHALMAQMRTAAAAYFQ